MVVDAIFPPLDINFPEGTSFEKDSEIIYIKQDFVFTKKGNPLYRVTSDLEGKKIGITSGYPYIKELTNNHLIQLEPMDSDEVNAQKLMKQDGTFAEIMKKANPK
jgi:hypothetical protein